MDESRVSPEVLALGRERLKLARVLRHELAARALIERTPDQILTYAAWVVGLLHRHAPQLERLQREVAVLRNALAFEKYWGIVVEDLAAEPPG